MSPRHRKLIEKYLYEMTPIFTKFGNYSQEDIDLIISCGRKVVYAGYSEMAKTGTISKIGIFGEPITAELQKKRPDLINGDTRFYFGSCRMAAEYIFKDTPEVINKVLKGAYRIVKGDNI